MITKEVIKENLYSSYFVAPDIILVYGEKSIRGLLLWDAAKSRIEFTNKPWLEFKLGDIANVIHSLSSQKAE